MALKNIDWQALFWSRRLCFVFAIIYGWQVYRNPVLEKAGMGLAVFAYAASSVYLYMKSLHSRDELQFHGGIYVGLAIWCTAVFGAGLGSAWLYNGLIARRMALQSTYD
jgi:hypothetical protein